MEKNKNDWDLLQWLHAILLLEKAETYKERNLSLGYINNCKAPEAKPGGLAEIKNVRENYQVDVTFSNQKIKG